MLLGISSLVLGLQLITVYAAVAPVGLYSKAGSANTNTTRDPACNQFYIFDAKHYQIDSVYSVGSISFKECQALCDARVRCEFYLFRHDNNKCYIYDIQLEAYIELPGQTIGPKGPTRADCIAKKDPCSGFVHENCNYILDDTHHVYDLIQNERECQEICNNYDDCSGYGYSTQEHATCIIYESLTMSCNGLIGMKNKEFSEECDDFFPHTTTAGSPTTVSPTTPPST